MDKMCIWINSKKTTKLFTVLMLVALNILNLIFKNKMFSTIAFVASIVFVFLLIYSNYKKNHKLSMIYLIGINVISMVHLFSSCSITFNVGLLWIKALLFLALAILGLIVVILAKKHFAKKITCYLIISLITVILNFGGFYESLYSMYFPYGQESFKIEQGMNWSQVVMPVDFIYYSADAFFGTDISDVSIKYIDYTDFYNEESTTSTHPDKYKVAINIINIVKMFSLIESMLFIVYISMIVMGIDNTYEQEEL